MSFRPRLEVLEDRHLLSSFLVVLATDNGGPTGQKVTATSGDLRYCFEQADAVHTATTDSIGFSSTLTSTPHTITLNSANGALVLSDSHPLTINGPAAHTVNVSGGGQVGVFDINSGTVTIKNLAIIYGNQTNGGGIYNLGTLTLTNCLLEHDSALAGVGGGIFNGGTATLTNCTLAIDSASQAGGIYNASGSATLTSCNLTSDQATSSGGGMSVAGGTATLNNCTFKNDFNLSPTAGGGGGGMYITGGTVTLSSCTFQADTAHGIGGAIYSNSFLTLTKCILSNDGATGGGGGIFNNGGTANLTQCSIGAIFYSFENNAGTATLTSCTVTGDGFYNLASATLMNCTLTSSLFNNGGTAMLSSCAVTASFVSVDNYNNGGTTLTNCTLNGGVFNGGSSNITLTNCTVANSRAGGVYNVGAAALTNCTIANNSVFAFGISSAAINGLGGGINNAGTVTLTNCTIANNSVSATNDGSGGAASYGGGMYNNGTATLTNCTVSANSSNNYGGGIFNSPGATLNLTNTIVAGNTAATTGPDVWGSITADHDLIGDGANTSITSGSGNIVGGNGNPVIDARLGPLQNNGGPTQTMALLAGSPAFGMADNSMAPATDQRGIIRIDEAGETTDIGAFEL